jgi:cytochrome P450
MFQSLSGKGLEKYKEIQQEEVHCMLVNLLDAPSKFRLHLRSATVKITMRLFYGLKIDDKDDFIKLNDEAVTLSTLAGAPTGYLVNTFPLLQHLPAFFPGTRFREVAKRGRILADRVLNYPVEFLKSKIDRGEAEPSFLSPYLQDNDESPEELYAAQAVAGTAYTAGVETSTAVLLTLVLAMLQYPDVQRKAQAEIDKNIPGKLPSTLDDLDKLPYVRAVVSECYRWATPAPLGLPRVLMEDDIVMGYTIPKGSIVLPNSWAILRDEFVYPRAEDFIPERFIGTNSQPDPKEHVFGYGRRICPGRYLADQVVSLAVANILAAFIISPLKDEDGRPVIPPYDFTSGIMSRPKEYECSIVARSERMAHIIRSNYSG